MVNATLQQVTAEPVRLAVTVNKDSLTCQLIQKAGRFAAVALDQRADMMAIGRFGFRTGRDMDKFEGIPGKRTPPACPIPSPPPAPTTAARWSRPWTWGTHLLFVGLAEESEILTEDEPLTYSYYRNVIKGLTPKGAPSYQAKK